MVKQKDRMAFSNNKLKIQVMIFIGLFLLLLIFHFITGNRLLRTDNIRNLIVQSVYPAFLGFGMMFIFGAGFIDFSIGANSIFAINMGVLTAQYLGWGYFGLIFTTIVLAVILEHITMLLAVRLEIPSWIAGLAMALIYETCLNEILFRLPFLKGTNNLRLEDYRILGTLPFMAGLWILSFIVASLLYHFTTLSFNLQAVGTSPQVATAMGINSSKTIYTAAIVGSIFVAVGAVVNISYTGQAYPTSGLGSISILFKPLAITQLANSVARYINKPLGIMLSSFLISCVFNVLTLLGVQSGTWQEFFLGAIVIICGIISNMKNNRVVK